jgi:hypothetical protein
MMFVFFSLAFNMIFTFVRNDPITKEEIDGSIIMIPDDI